MIRRIWSSLLSLKSVEFTSGFNVVLADRTKDSTKKDTRNGLGKSTLVDVIHFCLGAPSQRRRAALHILTLFLTVSLLSWSSTVRFSPSLAGWTIRNLLSCPAISRIFRYPRSRPKTWFDFRFQSGICP